MKNILIFLLTLVLSGISFAQNACGADEILKKNLAENPEKVILRHQLENHTKEFIKNYKHTAKMGQQYIIPVVVHIIHNYEEENISKEQVNRAMETVNEDWNAENDDISEIIDDFSDIIADFGVEFRLATIDPDGNCTHGITRTASPLTQGNDEAARSLISWPDENYVNIYVIKSMSPGSSAAAYANYPGAGDPYDLIVSRHDYFGHGVGTAGSSNYVRHTISHEFGHFMNLAHPWGGGEIDQEENCGTDDGVDDTPNTIGSNQNCDLNQVSCGSLDNVQNIMDYANCAHMFTEGQKDRVHAALNSIAGNRKNLWQEENLVLTGVDDAHFLSDVTYDSCAPIPDFVSTTNTSCQGTQIKFFANHTEESQDFESGDPIVITHNSDDIYYYWNFGEGANPQFSYEANPNVTYNEYGSHDVTLEVCNGSIADDNTVCNQLTRENYIYILEELEVSDSGVNQNFNNNFPEADGWYIVPQETENTWETTNIASWNDDTSIRIQSRYFGYGLNNHTFTTPELDLSSLSSARIYFNIAYALKSNQVDFDGNLYIQDKLTIYASDNCGESWTERQTFDTEDLITVVDESGNPLPIFNNFIPEGDNVNPGNWEERYVNLNPWAGDSDVIIKFEFTGVGIDEDGVNKGGNWLYIDNLRLGDNYTGLNEDIGFNLKLFPNPSDGMMNIAFDLFENETVFIELFDILGSSFGEKEINLNQGSHKLSLNEFYSNLLTGSYFISITIGEQKQLKKLTIIR